MIKTENDILFNRIKNSVGFDKSKRFVEWFHREYPGFVQHHSAGSYTGIKTSDYFSIPLTERQHQLAEANKSDFAINHLHVNFQVLIAYIKFLESNGNRKS